MTNQTNEAIERYKLEIVNNDGDQYIRCEPAPDGSWVMVKDVSALETRIAELEAALRHLDDLIVDLDAGHIELHQVSRFINTALEGGEDG